MKIVFVVIPISQEPSAACFNKPENPELSYKGKVRFSINGVLADKMKKDEEVKVFRFINNFKEEYERNDSEKNALLYKEELDNINSTIGAKISYCDIVENFDETKDIHKKRFLQCISLLEKQAEIFADITFGQKPMSPLLFAAMTFAEKFFDCDIQYVVYGQIKFIPNPEYVNETTTPDKRPKIKDLEHAVMHDVTQLYYLNNMSVAMDAPDPETAVKLVERFFTA